MIITKYGARHLSNMAGNDSFIPYSICPAADGKITELWQDDIQAVIVECPSGQYFTNQVHGMLCNHPLAEGILVILPITSIPHVGCWGGLTHGEREDLNKAIANFGIEVDIARLKIDNEEEDDLRQWGEAWIPVVGSMKGILTWGNCD